jgi:hypothetical protein
MCPILRRARAHTHTHTHTQKPDARAHTHTHTHKLAAHTHTRARGLTRVSHEAHVDVAPQLHASAGKLLAHATHHLQQQHLRVCVCARACVRACALRCVMACVQAQAGVGVACGAWSRARKGCVGRTSHLTHTSHCYASHTIASHLFDVQHAVDLGCDARCQSLKQPALPTQLLNGRHILICDLCVSLCDGFV